MIVMAITSQLREPFATGETALQDWQAAGLAKPSVLKPLIATLEKEQIVKKLGQLSAEDRKRLSSALYGVLGK